MCRVKTLDIPNVETRFYTDACPCHPAPIDYVEYWSDPHNTMVTPIAKAQHNAGLWTAIRGRYHEWKAQPLLLSYQPLNELSHQLSLKN